jgi:hypothetical protein
MPVDGFFEWKAINGKAKQPYAIAMKEGWDSGQFVIRTRQQGTSAQVIVKIFQGWYCKLGFVGCSSHSVAA